MMDCDRSVAGMDCWLHLMDDVIWTVMRAVLARVLADYNYISLVPFVAALNSASAEGYCASACNGLSCDECMMGP